jgi:hypothetical protein
VFNKKEQDLLRSLTTSDTALQKEDLSELITMLTPDDVKVFKRIGRTRATALTHEWNEAALAASGTWVSGVYADGGIPSDTSHTHTRKSNKVMSVGRVAKATGLMNALDLTLNLEGRGLADAFALDFTEKMQDLMRVIEYYILNGDVDNTSPQEMDGLLNTITTNSVTVNGDITAAKLKEALKKCYAKGGAPNAIYCRPGVAIKIADLGETNIRYTINAGERADLVGGATTFKWLSPFGNVMDVVPIRDEFLPSGKVVVLQESDVKLAFLSNEIEVMDLATTTDSMSKLIKAYFTLQHRAEQHSCLLTGVLDTY